MNSTQYDVIIIGTGAGGGTLAVRLAGAGKNILVLERGPFLPQEKLNWDTSTVFLDNRYHTKETWQDKDGKDLHPQQVYYVGGQTNLAAGFAQRTLSRPCDRKQISAAKLHPRQGRAEIEPGCRPD